MDTLFSSAEGFEGKRAKIKVLGLGGGGGNAINRMVDSGIHKVDLIAINTDAQDLRRNKAPYRVQIGEALTKGLGVGGDPDRGRRAAEESYEHIKQLVQGTDLLFITAGMGGGTGTGSAPVVAKVARETLGEDILIVGVVTRPFNFEGAQRMSQANLGIKNLRKYVDSLLVIPNERLFEIIDKQTSTLEAYRMADDVLKQAVQGISDVITLAGEVNVDFNDIKRIMTKSGEALIGIGQMSGEARHIEAARKAIESPLLENADLEGAKGLIVHFLAGEHFAYEQREVVDFIKESASRDAHIKFGIAYDDTMGDNLRVTVIATGFSATGPGKRRISLVKKKRQLTEEKYHLVSRALDDDNNVEIHSDDMMIPAFMRRKKK
jgi:cell division protein FtsZ